LARILERELKELGLSDVSVDEHCFVIARVPATTGCEHTPTIGLMAHLDTSNEVSGANVKPRVVRSYDGEALPLSAGWTLDPAEFPELKAHV
ncbi:peptidase T, partial [bacterium]|nr:peptidase T [bacterium]